MQQLAHIGLTKENILTLAFHQPWDLEDISALAKQVLGHLPDSRKLEHVRGADREYIRFGYQQSYFILHFETLACTCWIEAEDEQSEAALAGIHQHLLANEVE